MTEPVTLPRAIRYLPLSECVPAERNPRSHASIEKVKGSIRKYGFVEAAVHDDRTGRFIAGHGRHEALAAMHAEGAEVPDGILEDPVTGEWMMPVQFGWSSRNDDEAATVLVNLNRLTETGGWEDFDLAHMLDELRQTSPEDFNLSGFEHSDVDEMLAGFASDSYEELADPEDLDEAPAKPVRGITREGDVWVIGRHRLAVGDSTNRHVVDAALGGAKAQMVFTDPPYGVAYEGQGGMKIINDDLDATALGKLLNGAFRVMKDVLVNGGVFYVCSPSGRLETTFRVALERCELDLRQQLVWVKDSLVLSRSDYHGQHETMLYGWDGVEPLEPPHFDPDHETMLYGWHGGAAHTFEGGRKQTTTWLYPKPRRSDLHPTMKPVAMVRRAIANSSKPGVERGRVLDQFGGSGTTMVAAETTNRAAALVELDPPYADVILQRMLELFELDGVREGDGAVWSELSAGSPIGRNASA